MKQIFLFVCLLASLAATSQKMSNLPPKAAIAPASDYFIGVNSGVSYKFPASLIASTQALTDSIQRVDTTRKIIFVNSGTGNPWVVYASRDTVKIATPLEGNGLQINMIGNNMVFSLKVEGEYLDNAAAISAGLTSNKLYRTGDNLKIVH